MNAQYFIEKFSAIPEEQWCVLQLTDEQGRHCVYGHCGSDYMPEGNALGKILDFQTSFINDGEHSQYQQPTPKQRILAALEDARKEGK